jgi:membrane associated rhomboid family serine protease
VTNAILISNIATAVLSIIISPLIAFLALFVACTPPASLVTPWTFLTYPLVNFVLSTNDIFNLLLGGFFFWMTAGSLERSWGSKTFGFFFFGITLASSLSVLLGAYLLKSSPALYGFYLPMAGTIVAFCLLNPEQTISFMFFPLKARYVSLIVIIYTFVAFRQYGPGIGLSACGGVLAAYLYISYGRSWNTASRRSSGSYDSKIIDLNARRPTKNRASYIDGSIKRSPWDISGRMRDNQEKKKLERLLRNSGLIDPDDRDDGNRRVR